MIPLASQLKRLTTQPFSRFLFSTNDSNKQQYKVYIDEDSIKRKIKELKEKSQTVTAEEKKRRNPKDFMPTFNIPEVNQKVHTFRKETGTQDLFAFKDHTLEEKPTILQITGYDTQFIQVDSFEYPPSLILTPNQILNWEVESPENIRIEHFSILKCLNPMPDYVIVGVPDVSVIKQNLRQQLKKIHSKVDFLNLFQAISQFNTVADNDKYCIAFMMSCQ